MDFISSQVWPLSIVYQTIVVWRVPTTLDSSKGDGIKAWSILKADRGENFRARRWEIIEIKWNRSIEIWDKKDEDVFRK